MSGFAMTEGRTNKQTDIVCYASLGTVTPAQARKMGIETRCHPKFKQQTRRGVMKTPALPRQQPEDRQTDIYYATLGVDLSGAAPEVGDRGMMPYPNSCSKSDGGSLHRPPRGNNRQTDTLRNHGGTGAAHATGGRRARALPEATTAISKVEWKAVALHGQRLRLQQQLQPQRRQL